MRIELLFVPNCPHTDVAMDLLRDCLTTVHIQAEIEEREESIHLQPSWWTTAT